MTLPAEIGAVLEGRSEGCVVNADCLQVLPELPDGCVDLVLTDPPYGVGLGSKDRCAKMSKHGNDGYGRLDDKEYVETICVPAIRQSRRVARRVVLTPGLKNLFCYDNPDALWCLHWPNGAGIGRWKSFTCWQPLLCYGDAPDINGCFPDTFTTTEQADPNGHPCPKPIGLWLRICERLGAWNIVLDPFCGSGTTCVAAKMLGRRYIGIDVSPEYVRIAQERLRAVDTGVPVREQRAGQMSLFGEGAKK